MITLLFVLVFPIVGAGVVYLMGAALPVVGRVVMTSTGIFAMLSIASVLSDDKSAWPDSRHALYLIVYVFSAGITYALMFAYQVFKRFGLPLVDCWIGLTVAAWLTRQYPSLEDIQHWPILLQLPAMGALGMVGVAISLIVTHQISPARSWGEEPRHKRPLPHEA